jgi:undecaprenyl-diphosphatase
VNFKSAWQTFRAKWPVDKLVAVTALIIASTLFVFVELSNEVSEGETLAFDNFVLASFREPANPANLIGPEWLLTFVQEVSCLGGVSIIALITTLVVLFFAVQRRWHMICFFLVSFGGGALAMVLMKNLFNRPRPSIVPHLSHVSLGSYPSGHSMVAAIVYLTLGALLARSTSNPKMRMYYLVSACFLTIIIGFSRILLGVHYPSDVLAGWCAGIIWAGSSYLIAMMLQRRGLIEKGSAKGKSAGKRGAAAGKDEVASGKDEAAAGKDEAAAGNGDVTAGNGDVIADKGEAPAGK